jgi:hypothetical protein
LKTLLINSVNIAATIFIKYDSKSELQVKGELLIVTLNKTVEIEDCESLRKLGWESNNNKTVWII